ncbi:MAG TPA: hypothetical protein PKD72_07445 [Gemmatales bacterium]|nr:hypothetical protein [Gemmatales bacterium]
MIRPIAWLMMALLFAGSTGCIVTDWRWIWEDDDDDCVCYYQQPPVAAAQASVPPPVSPRR